MDFLAGLYHYDYSEKKEAMLYINNAIIKNSCIVINGYKCPLVFITQNKNPSQYNRVIYVSIVIPTLQNYEDTVNWIKNSPEGSTVETQTITITDGVSNALLKDSIASVDINKLKQYGLTIVYLACGGTKNPFRYMSQDDDARDAYPPPALFNLPTFFGIDNVSAQENLYAFWKKYAGEYIPWAEDNSTTGGGDGDWYDDSSDTIGLPDLTALNQNSISNTKFFSCYQMTPNQLSVLSEHLWTDWRNIAEAIGNSILKPLDFFISLNMLPVTVDSSLKVIKMGWFDLNHAVKGGLIKQQYVRIDCGSLTVKKKWGGAIDYQTDVSLFLPFIGEVTLNANEVMGATLTVIYTVDVMSGNCIASVQVVKDELNAILYQYNGNVASNFSITSLDYSNVMAGALQLAVAVGSGAGRGVGAFTSAVSSASNLLSGAEVRRAGNLSATSGFMGIKKPYLILSRPIQSLPSEYNTFRGFVSNITLALSECSGYTKVAEIHLENIPATSAELDELDGLLKAGVIF